MTMTTTCAHVELAERSGWGTCPDCGQMENADRVRNDIAERLELYTEVQYQEVIDESREQGWQDGRDYWWDEATDVANAQFRAWAAPRIAMLSEAIETLNDRLEITDQNDEEVDAAIAHLWEVRDDLDREGWAQ